MLTTGLFTLHRHEIKIKKIAPVEIWPFGDIHRNAPMCHVELWKQFLEDAKAAVDDGKNVLFLGMGDYDDLMSASERALISNGKLHESTLETLEDFAKSKTYGLAQELDFMRGRLIGCLNGNHYFEFQSGITSDELLCDHLKCKFLGVSAMIRLTINYQGKKHILDLWAHHGKGASRLVGGSINRVEQMRETMHADIYLMGHDHKKGVVPVDCLELRDKDQYSGLRLHHKVQLLCRTGSYLRGYTPGKASYIADRCAAPCALGNIVIQVRPHHREGSKSGTYDWTLHGWS